MESLSAQISLFHTIFLVCLILCIIFIIIDILLFIKLKIAKVYGYLSGKTAKKAIEEMMEADETSGGLPPLLKKSKEKKEKSTKTVFTPSGEMKMPGSNQVMPAIGGDTTDMLATEKRTDPIQEERQSKPSQTVKGQGRFVIIREIMFTHTEEYI